MVQAEYQDLVAHRELVDFQDIAVQLVSAVFQASADIAEVTELMAHQAFQDIQVTADQASVVIQGIQVVVSVAIAELMVHQVSADLAVQTEHQDIADTVARLELAVFQVTAATVDQE